MTKEFIRLKLADEIIISIISIVLGGGVTRLLPIPMVVIQKNKPIYKRSIHEINTQIVWNTNDPCRYIITN